MGRGKIEIKRIDKPSNRHVTYSKRRKGLLKKAAEISILCDAKISVIIISSSGKIDEYCSPSTTLNGILEIYHGRQRNRLWDAKHENMSNEIEMIKRDNDNMQIRLRHLKGEDITSLNYKELMDLEKNLENGLTRIRTKQAEIINDFRKDKTDKAKTLTDRNKELRYILHEQEMTMDGVMDYGYHQRVGNYHSQMPFAFRAQPMHPNLQDRA